MTKKLTDWFPEINPANYDDDEVNALNAWGIAAHTALESLSAEVERLRTVNADQYGALDLAARECSQLRAQLEARGEAFGWVRTEGFGTGVYDPLFMKGATKPKGYVSNYIPVYTHPAPVAPVVDAIFERCNVTLWFESSMQYPLEHKPHAGKDNKAAILDALHPICRDDTEHGVNYYTAEALRDVLEQAALRCDILGSSPGSTEEQKFALDLAADRIRDLIKEVK